MVFAISESGFAPAFQDEGDELFGRQDGWFFYDGVKMMAKPCPVFSDHQHRQLAAMALIRVPEQTAVQQASKVFEIRLGDVVINPLTINHLLLCQGDIDRVRNRVSPIELFDGALQQDEYLFD